MNSIHVGLQALSTNAEYWAAIDGDHTLRLNYDLDKSSVVFDLGGYQGDWSEQIYRRYGCRLLVFEPVPSFASRIVERFRGNPDVSIFGFALGPRRDKMQLTLSDNATSSFVSGRGTVLDVEVRNFAEFLDEQKIEDIDLLKINIEGGEFELLNHLISTGYIFRVRHVQVQFHQFVPGANELMQDIRKRLWLSHTPSYSLDWIWDSWARKASSEVRNDYMEGGLKWHQQALREMSLRASISRSRIQELEASNRILAEESRILNAWRNRFGLILRMRRLFQRKVKGL
jgi:FkbM family methyltransferase